MEDGVDATKMLLRASLPRCHQRVKGTFIQQNGKRQTRQSLLSWSKAAQPPHTTPGLQMNAEHKKLLAANLRLVKTISRYFLAQKSRAWVRMKFRNRREFRLVIHFLEQLQVCRTSTGFLTASHVVRMQGCFVKDYIGGLSRHAFGTIQQRSLPHPLHHPCSSRSVVT